MYVYFKHSSSLENVCVERHLPFQGLYYRGMVKTFPKHVFLSLGEALLQAEREIAHSLSYTANTEVS